MRKQLPLLRVPKIKLVISQVIQSFVKLRANLIMYVGITCKIAKSCNTLPKYLNYKVK